MRRSGIAGIVVLVFSIALIASAAPLAAAASPSEIMLARPLVPTDRDVFSTYVYPDASPMSPASGGEPSAQQVSHMLDTYLKAEFPGDPASQNAAKAIFNSAAAKSKIPSASLRAALAALKGTIGAPAINYILKAKAPGGQPKVTSVKWVPPSQTPDPTRAIAGVYGSGAAGFDQIEIRFNNRYQAENPFLFVATMAHEPLHQDSSVANYEEAVNTSLEELISLHQLALHPGLAALGTELSRRRDAFTLERLNSGLGSRLGLFADNANRQLFPGSTADPSSSWWEGWDTGDTTSTPGNALLGKYLANIHASGAPTCSQATFSKALLHCIDKQGNAGLTTSELIKAAKAMKLDTDVERDRTLSISYKRSAFKGTLSSKAKPCTRTQTVSIYKQKSGTDPKIGSDETDSNGAYSVEGRNVSGKFYAKASRSTVAGTGVCLEATSSAKRVGLSFAGGLNLTDHDRPSFHGHNGLIKTVMRLENRYGLIRSIEGSNPSPSA